jgi:hypothetical protein
MEPGFKKTVSVGRVQEDLTLINLSRYYVVQGIGAPIRDFLDIALHYHGIQFLNL